MVERPGTLRDSSENAPSPEHFVAFRRYPITSPKDAQQRRPGRPMRNFQDLRVMSMTKTRECRRQSPNQGTRILSCGIWFSLPRGNEVNKKVRREIEVSRRSIDGIARAIESLRGVRMSLVPRPNNRECLLSEV